MSSLVEVISFLVLCSCGWLVVTKSSAIQKISKKMTQLNDALVRERYYYFLVAGIVIFLGIIPILFQMPFPFMHDESSLLLMGETFASGNITNPTHPMWKFFEAIHVFHEPTYTGKFPPVQALFLALGFLIGHPIAGVLVSSIFAAVACTWALRSRFEIFWAGFGGVFYSIYFGFTNYFAQSYWGGSAAFGFGALLIGSYLRLMDRYTVSNWITFILSSFALGNTRPFEATMLCLFTCVSLLISKKRNGKIKEFFSVKPILILLLLSVSGASLMGLYNYKVTGDVTKLPYVHHEELYAYYPPIIWMDKAPPRTENYTKNRSIDIHHKRFAPLITYREYKWDTSRSVKLHAQKITKYISFYGGMFFLASIFALLFTKHREKTFLIGGILIGGFSCVSATFFFPHYIAPFGIFTLFIIVRFAQMIIESEKISEKSTDKGRAALVLCIIFFGVLTEAIIISQSYQQKYLKLWAQQVVEIKEYISSNQGKHLVFHKRQGDRSPTPHQDLVYNGPKIDEKKIVFARYLGQETNKELIKYYPGRSIWFLIETDNMMYKLIDGRNEKFVSMPAVKKMKKLFDMKYSPNL
jgi:hypothetical protein